MGPACSYQSCQHLPVSLNSGRGWTAQDINFLTGIAARRHHSQVRNNPWTMFFYGDSLHQKVAGRSSPTPIITPAVSLATGENPSRESFLTTKPWRRNARQTLDSLISSPVLTE